MEEMPNMIRGHEQNMHRGDLVAALDVGTTKICCLIGRWQDRKNDKASGPAIVGFGHQVSMGIRAGTVNDMDQGETAIRATVEAAELMAGDNIKEVFVNVSCANATSKLIAYDVALGGHEISDADLRRVLDPSVLDKELSDDREYIHRIPVGYTVDGSRGVHDPRGMFGDRLGVNMHVINAKSAPLRNLETTISRCHLGLAGKVSTPYASSLSTLVADEKQMGVTCIDLGGGTTTMAVYFDGELVHTDQIAIGGDHVTRDIARGLSAPLEYAERMKTLYGNAMPSARDDSEILHVPLVGEENMSDVNQVPRSMLVSIIKPRLEETFELVQQRLTGAGFGDVAGRRVVLTGGASQLSGLPELAGRVLDKQVRIARVRGLHGLPEAASGPAFATASGLLHYAFSNTKEISGDIELPIKPPSGRFGRVKQWLRENF